MIFRTFKLYRDVKKGTADPTGFAFEGMRETVLGMMLVPLIILALFLLLLGILGFTDWIVHASGVARVFFWIFAVIGIIFGIPIFVVGSVASKLLKRSEDMARPHVTRIKTKVEDVAQKAFDTEN